MNFARALFAVSGLTMVSRVAGFGRDLLTAAFLGAGPIADAFFVAQRLPNLFRSLFAEGAFNAAFVPEYTKTRNQAGDGVASQFAGAAAGFLFWVLVPLTLLFIWGMPWLMQLLAPGFTDNPEKFGLAVTFGQITIPYLLLISLTALQGAVLNAHGHFSPAAAAPIIYNIFMMLMLLLAWQLNWDFGFVLAWSVTLAGVVQLLWLYVACRRYGLTIPMAWPRLTPPIRDFFRKLAPGALGAGAAQINLAVSTIMASLLPTGAVSHLFYADRLYQLPLGVVGIAVATALLPILSQHIANQDTVKTRHYFSRAIEFALALGLPAMLGLMLAAEPIIQTLFERGAFTAADTQQTAAALACFAVGIPAFLLVKVFSTAFFAHHDTSTPMRIALVVIALNIILCLTLPRLMGHEGIALASGIATWANAILLFFRLRAQPWSKGADGQGLADTLLDRRLPRLLLSAAVMALTIVALNWGLHGWFAERHLLQEIFGLALLLAGAGLAFVGLTQLTGAMRWQDVPAMLRRPPTALSSPSLKDHDHG